MKLWYNKEEKELEKSKYIVMLNQEKEIKLIINELKNAENKTLKKEQIQDIQKRLEQLI